jgi:FixJ family two-component response regulator
MTSEPQVFVVDDDRATCASITALVQSMGVRSETYTSAEDFLARYDDSQPGCLVLDMRLSGMSGLELLESLSQRPVPLPTLIVTAYADVPLAVRAMRLGAFTVLQKPYRNQELWDAISKALAHSERQMRNAARFHEARRRLDSLTDDEKLVLDLILSGKTNKGIARELRLGLRTVEARRHSIMVKFGAHSLPELVRLFCESHTLGCQLRPGHWEASGGKPTPAGQLATHGV